MPQRPVETGSLPPIQETVPLMAAKNVMVTSVVPSPPGKSSKLRLALRQWLCSLGPLGGVLCAGMTTGFSAVLLPQLNLPDSDITISDEEASWIASVILLSMAVGCGVSGPLIDWLGRRKGHQLVSLIMAAGWGMQAAARSVTTMVLGRLVAGFGVGVSTPLITVYIAEISSPSVRGLLLSAVSTCVSLGVLLSHVLGILLNWRLAAAICAVPALLFLLGATLSPESPSWLLSRGHNLQAETVFFWLRGSDEKATQELEEMRRHLKNGHNVENKPKSPIGCLQLWRRMLKPLLVMCLFFVVQQWSGVNAVTFYSVSLLGAAVSGQGVFTTLVVDVVRVGASVLACQLVWRYGRRKLAAVSGLGTGASIALLGILLLVFSNPHPAALISLLVSYMIFVSLGLLPLPWIMIGEVFPNAARGLGSGLSSCFCFFVIFSVVKTGPLMLSHFGSGGCFLFYGLVTLIGTVLVLIWLPETRNKTLQQIEDDLASKTPLSCEESHLQV